MPQVRSKLPTTGRDRKASERQVFDVQRFTREDHEQGRTVGWRLYGGWYRRTCGLVWAWFRREVKKERTQWK